MKPATILFIFAAIFASNTFAATRDELAIPYSGPLKISPWRAASETENSPAYNHYIYASPLPFYYCGYYGCGFGYGFSGYSSFYGYGFSNAYLLRGTSVSSDYPR
jgi:hypothetical protein